MLNQLETSVVVPAAPADEGPSPAGRADPEVSGLLLRALANVVTQYDVTPESLFQSDAKALLGGDPVNVRVPLPAYRGLLRRALALTGDAALGLRYGLRASESAFDLMAPLTGHVSSLRHGIREAKRFQPLAIEGAYLHQSEGAGVARLRWELPRADETTDRSLAEFLTAGIMRMLRAFGSTRDDVYAVCFEHRRPVYHAAYTAAFEGAERFSAAYTGIEFKAHLLDRPNLHANPALQGLVRTQAEQYLLRLSRPATLVDRLQTYLRNQASAGIPDMANAARDLGVSIRTLRRRLEEEGHSYRSLTQDLQCDRARTMLRDPDFTLQAVADALGFADAASFHRAFKRWTGLTAAEYRRAR